MLTYSESSCFWCWMTALPPCWLWFLGLVIVSESWLFLDKSILLLMLLLLLFSLSFFNFIGTTTLEKSDEWILLFDFFFLSIVLDLYETRFEYLWGDFYSTGCCNAVSLDSSSYPIISTHHLGFSFKNLMTTWSLKSSATDDFCCLSWSYL